AREPRRTPDVRCSHQIRLGHRKGSGSRKWDRSMGRNFAPEHDGMRLDRAVVAVYPEHSRSFVAKLIDDGCVSIDGKTVTKPSLRVSAGQRIDVDVPPPAAATAASQHLPLALLFEDDDRARADKPAGRVVPPAAGHSDGTLVNALLFHVRDL